MLFGLMIQKRTNNMSIKPTVILHTDWDKKKKKATPVMIVIVTPKSVAAAGKPGTINAEIASNLVADMASMKGKDYEEMAQELIGTRSVQAGGYGKSVTTMPYSGGDKTDADKIMKDLMNERVEDLTKKVKPKK
jgi:hypothetical protein